MLLQTNSYVVPKEKRAEHARLLNRFRQTMTRLGCESFDVFEQAGANWGSGEPSGRYVQLIRFRDKKHHQAVQQLERSDPSAQKLIAEFCELINFPYQQQQGLFAVGFYNSVLPVPPSRRTDATAPTATESAAAVATAAPAAYASQEVEETADVGMRESSHVDAPASERVASTNSSTTDELELDLTELDLPDPTLDDPADDHIELDTAGRNGNHLDDDDELGDVKR